MQGKGLIKVIAVLLLILSVYQLIFTWKSNQIERTARNEAVNFSESLGLDDEDTHEAMKVYEQNYLDSIYDQKVFLNLFTYKQIKKAALKLGLDLKGGMSVVLEADIPNLLGNISNDANDPNLVAGIDLAKEAQKTSQDDFVNLFVQNYPGTDEELYNLFHNADNSDELGANANKEEVRNYLAREADDAFNSTYDIIQARIDKFGMQQPSIHRQNEKKRILIEIPGVENPARVRSLLQSSANLEFYEVYDNAEFNQYLQKANDALRLVLAERNLDPIPVSPTPNLNDAAPEPEEEITEPAQNSEELAQQEARENQSEENLKEEDKQVQKDEEGLDALLNESTDSEVDSLDVQKELREQYPLFQALQLSQQAGPIIGFAAKKDTALVNRYLRVPEVRASFPANAKLAWEAKADEYDNEDGTKVKFFRLLALRGDFDGEPQLDGAAIKTAYPDTDIRNKPSVSMTMNTEGANKWYELTKKNEGKPMAIVLDNKVYSYPNINEPISGGRSQISGNFTQQEATDLSTILKTGKLEVPAKIIEEEVVGPTIGGESAQNGVLSLVFGMLLVLIFILIYYARAGAIADFALLFNLILVIGILAAFGSTLTLPGIAGLVLTIGMAVDSNVIIFERIREELRKGINLSQAINKGYKASYSAIIDANVTTLIIAFILLTFGVGPIKGFAVVLIIGIFTSLFTGVVLTRALKDDFLKKSRSITYWTKASENWFQNLNFDFLGKRKIAYAISGTLVVLSLINIISRGINAFDLGVDLSGGRSYTVRFEEPKSAENIKTLLDENLKGTSNIVRTFGKAEQLKITTTLMNNEDGPEVDEKAEAALFNALKAELPNGITNSQFKSDYLMNRQKVDATIADDLRGQSIILTGLSLLAIFVYLLIRFRKWQFGLAAVATLAHDSLVVLLIFSLGRGILPFALDIDQAFIAAMLTIIGYSINDTVIVFDRIREELGLHPKKELHSVVNYALNHTLSRTIITSMTTIFVVLCLFIFGGEVIRGFAFALLLGIFVGTYSSIFVATPIVVDLYKKNPGIAKK